MAIHDLKNGDEAEKIVNSLKDMGLTVIVGDVIRKNDTLANGEIEKITTLKIMFDENLDVLMTVNDFNLLENIQDDIPPQLHVIADDIKDTIWDELTWIAKSIGVSPNGTIEFDFRIDFKEKNAYEKIRELKKLSMKLMVLQELK